MSSWSGVLDQPEQTLGHAFLEGLKAVPVTVRIDQIGEQKGHGEAFVREHGMSVDYLINNAGGAGPELPAKAYLIALSEELALVLKGNGVHVTAHCPGFVHTDFHEAAGLMDMKRSLPAFIWYDAATVVREGLDAVERGRPIMVSGRLYRWLDPLTQSVWIRPLLKAVAPGR